MQLSKPKRLMVVAAAYVALLFLPSYTRIYYETAYFAGFILLLPMILYRIVREDKFDAAFHRRWGRAKKQGFAVNVLREGLRGLAQILVIVAAGQLFGSGLTPANIVSFLPGGAIAVLLLLLLFLGCILGLIAWYENNKRYAKIDFRLRKQSTGQ